ncbi:MAG: hypothetical protein RJA35_265 [Actinomycetota bacterium]
MSLRKKILTAALALGLVLSAQTGARAAVSNDDNQNDISWGSVESGNCLVTLHNWGFKACTKGVDPGIWRVAFIGDSHMRQYFAPLDVLAHRYKWHVKYISKSACTVGDWQTYPHNRNTPSCWDWNRRLQKYLAGNPPFDLIVNSNSAFDSQADPAMAAAYKKLVVSQLQRGTQWLVISDNPKPANGFENCIAKDVKTAEFRCRTPYSVSMKPVDILPRTIHALPGVTVADFRTTYCPHECPAFMRGVKVYRDFSHISDVFARTMLPELDAVIPDKFKNIERIAIDKRAVRFDPVMKVSTLLTKAFY